MKHDLSTYLRNLLGFFFEIQALLIVNFRGILKNVADKISRLRGRPIVYSPRLQPVTPDPLDEVADGGHQHVLLTAREAGHLRLALAVPPLHSLLQCSTVTFRIYVCI